MLKPDGIPATVLVADDVSSYRELLSGLLEEEGYRVICAVDGEEALKILHSQPVDLVLLDVMMPCHTGFAVCRQVKADPTTRLLPVVLITWLNDVEDRVEGIECGADDFLSKPFHREELLARVRSLLRVKQFTDELENAETVLLTLALSIEAKDPYTEGHCERLSRLSANLAEQVGLPEEQRLALKRAGIVHDIGKVAMPESILLKPGPLRPEERALIEQHTAIGERICAPLKSFRLVLPLIRHHHERLDGSGYPDGLKADQIPLGTRILSAVDVYDALTTYRPYRRALSPVQAFAEIRAEVRRGWWDGSLVDHLEEMLRNSAKLLDGAGAWRTNPKIQTAPAR